MATEPPPPRDEGLMESLRRVTRSFLAMLFTRLEILSTEVAEERMNLSRLLFVALTVLFCLQVGIIFGLLFFVLAVSPEHRVAAVGIAGGVMLLGALVGGLWLRGWLKSRPPLFAATIAELKKDRERIRSRS